MKIFSIPQGYEGDNCCCPYCGFVENTPPHKENQLPTGFVINERYIIGTVRGAGGFGITYRAWDKTLDTKVAIKEYFPQGIVTRTRDKTVSVSFEKQSKSFNHGKEKFLKEARSLAKLSNQAGTVNVHDFFEANGTAYIVMEYLDGCNMREYIEKTKKLVDYKLVRKMISDIGDTLCYIHDNGIIHRDISPDNVFFCRNGSFKLIDFGAIREKYYGGESVDVSVSSTVIVKKGFAPIEQYSSEGRIGPWTDIYAFGATVYYLLSGVKPTESTERVLEDNLLPLYKLNSKVPVWFSNAVMRAMAVRAEDRFQNMKDFKDALLYPRDVDLNVSRVDQIEAAKSSNMFQNYNQNYIQSVDQGYDQNIGYSQNYNQNYSSDYSQNGDYNTSSYEYSEMVSNDGNKKVRIFTIASAAFLAVALIALLLVFFLLPSEGDKLVSVPEVTGMSETKARDKIEDAGLKVSVSETPVYNAEPGEIISQTHHDDRVKNGSNISIVKCSATAVHVPDVVGMNRDKAERELTDAGLKVNFIEVYTNSKPEGTVMDQTSYRNERIVIDNTPGQYTKYKDSEGETEEEDKSKTGKSGEYIGNASNGDKYEIADNKTYQKGDIVDVVVSSSSKTTSGNGVATGNGNEKSSSAGSEIATVPDVVGMKKDAAIDTIRSSSLNYQIVDATSETVAKDVVIEQNEKPGTKLTIGSYVMITVSKGKPEKKDEKKPEIKNVQISNKTSDGYDVTCDVSDDVEVTKVSFPTWTLNASGGNDQDDVLWKDGSLDKGVATFHVSRSDHNDEYGKYVTHIYAYDASGKYEIYQVDVVEISDPSGGAAGDSGGEGWGEYNGHTYFIMNDSISASDAYSMQDGSYHLATITSAGEMQFILSLIGGMSSRSTGYWLGADDLYEEGNFEWITGEPFTYNEWPAGQPDNYSTETGEDENYLGIWADGTWNDFREGYKLGYILESY